MLIPWLLLSVNLPYIPNTPSTIYYDPFPLLRSYQNISPGPRLSVWTSHNKVCFNAELLLAFHPTPKLEDHPLSAVRDCYFNIFTSTLHVGGCSSIIHSLRTCHAVVWQGPTDDGLALQCWRKSCLIYGLDTPTTIPYNSYATPDVLDIIITKDLVTIMYLTTCCALS